MATQNGRKRPIATIDLTASSDDDITDRQRKQARTQTRQLPTPTSSYAISPAEYNSFTPSSSGQLASSQANVLARSQASQFRHDEDGGNELVEGDVRYDDVENYVLYGIPHEAVL
jgi:hypothetical protein